MYTKNVIVSYSELFHKVPIAVKPQKVTNVDQRLIVEEFQRSSCFFYSPYFWKQMLLKFLNPRINSIVIVC